MTKLQWRAILQGREVYIAYENEHFSVNGEVGRELLPGVEDEIIDGIAFDVEGLPTVVDPELKRAGSRFVFRGCL